MKTGCILCKKVPQGNLKTVGFCQLFKKDGISIVCEATPEDKKKCPEWSQAFAYESYLKEKLELEINEDFS